MTCSACLSSIYNPQRCRHKKPDGCLVEFKETFEYDAHISQQKDAGHG